MTRALAGSDIDHLHTAMSFLRIVLFQIVRSTWENLPVGLNLWCPTIVLKTSLINIEKIMDINTDVWL
jgi:hypothetical protein